MSIEKDLLDAHKLLLPYAHSSNLDAGQRVALEGCCERLLNVVTELLAEDDELGAFDEDDDV